MDVSPDGREVARFYKNVLGDAYAAVEAMTHRNGGPSPQARRRPHSRGDHAPRRWAIASTGSTHADFGTDTGATYISIFTT
jgi:hypothetical protein